MRIDKRAVVADVAEIIKNFYLLLLNRKPNQEEAAEAAIALSRAVSAGKFLLELADSDERKKLVGNRRIYIARKPEISLIELLKFIKNRVDEAGELAVIVSEEYMLSLRLWQLAVTVRKKSDNYASPTQTLRMLQIASRTNYLDYTWIEHRARARFGNFMSNIWPSSSFLKEHLSCHGDSLSNETLAGVTQNQALLADAYAHDLYENLDVYSPEDILEKISLNCDILRLPGYAKRAVKSLFENIYSPEVKPQMEAPAQGERLPVLINVAGFGNSGSSAIFDYLKDNEACAEIFPLHKWPYNDNTDVETMLFLGGDSIYELSKCSEYGLKKERVLTRFILKNLLSFVYPYTTAIEQLKNSKSMIAPFTFHHREFNTFIDIIYAFACNFININHGSSVSMKTIVFNMLLRFAQVFNHDLYKRYMIFTNSIPATFIDTHQILPDNAISLIIYRNPMDQFVSLNTLYNMSGEAFIQFLRHNLDHCLEMYGKYCRNNVIIPISYECFVTDGAYRRSLCEKLDIKFLPRTASFNPEFSMSRIGKHKTFHDQGAIAQIGREFPELLNHEFENNFKDRIA